MASSIVSSEKSLLHCPTFLWHNDNGPLAVKRPLTPKDLVELSKKSPEFPLTYTKSENGDDKIAELTFQQHQDLLGKQIREKLGRPTCHFEAVSEWGEHSALSACSVDSISGILHIDGKVYTLSSDGNGFNLIPQGSATCEWSHVIKKRSAGKYVNPDIPSYYKDYLDGIKRYVELVFIADHSIYLKYGKDETKIHDRLHSIASVVNSLYAPLNIRVTLVWADIWAKADVFEVTAAADKVLSEFLAYRKALLNEHPHDNAHLITDMRFGEVIGKAYKGTMCSYDFSGGVIVDHSEHTAFVGGTVAHEMGHNFGMEHDAGYPEPCKCSALSCIMSPSSSVVNSTTYFSDCSLEFLDHALRRGVDYCLHNVPKAAFGGAKCGNGILEAGEECDCGSTVSCPNKCCVASTCKMAEGAECADGDCCDPMTCKPRQMATKCRDATNSCDLPEFCDGKNPSCPPDFFVQNGLPCPDDSDDFCYEGMCGSRDQQCKFIWGSTGKDSAPECYAYNEGGTHIGNCGYDLNTERYIPCKRKDVACGRLQCNHLAEKPVFGDPSTIHSAYSFVRLVGGQDVACRVIRTTYTGGKRKPDPGMVPDGAKCGKDKLCINSECKNHSEVVQMVSKCEPVNCNLKGICNNMGNCHCQNGYGGVGCDIPGFGGSVNGGPANDTVFNPGIVLLYLFIITAILFCVATYYCKTKKKFWLHKEMWRYIKKTLDLQSVLVPIRKAPPPPGTVIQHPHRFSFSAAWSDPPAEVVQVTTLKAKSAIPTTMAPAKVTIVQHAQPSARQAESRFNIKNENATSPPSGSIKHPRKSSNMKPMSKMERRALKAESSSDEHPFEPEYAIKNSNPVAFMSQTEEKPPPPPPHKRPSPEKTPEANNETDDRTQISSKNKPKLPTKPPVAAKPVKPTSTASTGAETKPVSVKQLAAKFDATSSV
ncbi:reprolysin (M12B) family zinc metalloprotease domain-containing protein [Ditylenchus destructor]|uniref:Reprolysin (M12B) family zinc metalloprotease domain-containing protein n=1 Tax=Ditylenchus destructor TaxID=166010 RepID=A0AAD4NAK5_9BILA|nr:reprolysin (M12B) family zinc metalloprotease domain-containing protein [Ditylenchus destructor]